MKKIDSKNAEVTTSGVKKRGEQVKGKTQTVVVNGNSIGKIKKNLLYASTTIMAAGAAIGLIVNWTPELVHVAYPMGGLFLAQLLLILTTKME